MKSKPIFKFLIILISTVISFIVIFFAVLQITEFRPENIEISEIRANSPTLIQTNESIKLITWNLGYCALGETADFFMDGGKSVMSQSKEEVEGNIAAVSNYVENENPDIVLFQEIDFNSKRSYGINELDEIQKSLHSYSDSTALNYSCIYVPFPFPSAIGKVNSGLVILNRFKVTESIRQALPIPFAWPVRLANLKRGLLVERLPIEDSDKEFVLINLHLEAYDSGEGKIEQTKVLSSLLESEYKKGNYVIAGGDFNQSFPGANKDLYPQINKDLWQPGNIESSAIPEGFSIKFDESSPSCRSLDRPYASYEGDFQYYLIDGFLVSDNIKIQSIETVALDFKNSDHNPVKINISLE